ncbi:hypothetical protein KY337_06470, partial [Candidatus Woesearchaeota archaeon]|nr:hypothetical protein [Candidatus Woesearchaeota archaeon]
MGNILKGIGSKTGATTIEEVVDNEVKGALSRGLITAAAGAGHGFSLGAQIKAGEIASEELYNKMKEEKLFDTPETFTEAFHQVMESGLDMAMGSVLLGVPKTFQKSLKENNYEGITSDELEILNAYANSSEFLEFKKAQIGQKVASREITKEQGVQEIAALETNISIYKSIPENLSDAGKRKAMGLLSEKRQLDSFIQGKDKALVKKQIDRIAEINKQLEALPDMKEEAPAPAEAPAAPEAQLAKPKTLDEIQDDDLKSTLNFYKEYLEHDLKLDEEDYNKAKENFDSKNPIVRFFSKKPSYEQYTQYTKNKLELLNNNPEQYISDAIKEYEESKKEYEKDGEEYPQGKQETLDYLKNQLSKIQEENAIQEPTTEESVLRTEQPEVELPTMGEGNAQKTTAQEGVSLEKQKAHIERRRKAELQSRTNKIEVSRTEYTDTEGNVHSVREFEDGHFEHWITPADSKVPQNVSSNSSNIYTKEYLEDISGGPISEGKSVAPKTGLVDKINAKYDAELAELEKAPAKPEEVTPQEGSVGETLTDEERYERRDKNRNIIDAEGSTYWDDISFNNTKIGDEIHYTDNKGVQHKTKVKDIVDGDFVFENGQTRDDVSSYMNITAEDAWFDKNKPKEKAPAKPEEVKPTEAKSIEQELAELEQMFPETKTGENKGVAASDTKAMDEMHSRAADERVQKVIRTAQKLTKTLKSLFPNAEINIHETEESYNGAMEEINAVKGSNGNFAFGVVDGKPFVRIDINANTASSRDVAHEVAHAVLAKTFGDNQKLFQSFQEKIAKVISTDSNQKLIDFANNPV